MDTSVLAIVDPPLLPYSVPPWRVAAIRCSLVSASARGGRMGAMVVTSMRAWGAVDRPASCSAVESLKRGSLRGPGWVEGGAHV